VTMPAALQLQIRGTVTWCGCSTERTGHTVLTLEMADTSSGQTVRAHHRYPDASNSTSFVAAALARQLRGQMAEITAINCRFRAKRLDCEATHIHTPTHQLRKDQQ